MQAEGSVFEGSTALAACLKCAPAMLFGAVGAAAVAAAAAAAAAVAADNDAGGVSGPQSNNAHFRSHVLDPGKQEQAAELLWGGAAAAAAAAAVDLLCSLLLQTLPQGALLQIAHSCHAGDAAAAPDTFLALLYTIPADPLAGANGKSAMPQR